MDGMAYAEIIEILDNMSSENKNKIPKKVYDFFLEHANKNYKKHLNKNMTLCDQEIREDTKEILAILLTNYWCETEEKKNNILKMFRDNEIKYQEQLHEKYNPDDLFKNKKIYINSKEEILEDCTDMVICNNKNILAKLIDRIKSFFKFGKNGG